jgi:hypothetical protein
VNPVVNLYIAEGRMPTVSYHCVQLSLVRAQPIYIRNERKLVRMEGNNRYFETFVNRGRTKLGANPKQYPRVGHFMNPTTGGSKTG